MATTFFQQQALARTRTKQLIFLYGCAVILIIMAVYLVIYGVWYMSAAPASIPSHMLESQGVALPEAAFMPVLLEPWLFLRVALITGGIILLGTIYKILALGKGGPAVAQALGGRLIDSETRDFNERKGLNVVEEMAIASGLPVPPVYVLENENSINAFAAGFGTSDAVIGVTKGCLEKLSRDELQGVIGHEFSHVLNGDMRLNIKLIGILHGILLIGLIGETLMRVSGRSSSDDNKGIGAALVITGVGLFVIGFIGVFFGRLIKSAVSRQREFLADASSVQFTRNPPGLVGALKKILGFAEGSDLSTPKAEQASHMFFSNCLARRLVNIFATHPPLIERIKRIDPSFRATTEMIQAEVAAETQAAESDALAPQSRILSSQLSTQSPSALLESVGRPGVGALAAAAATIERLDSTVRSAAQNELGARALVCGMLIASNAGRTQASREELYQKLGSDLAVAVEKLLPHIEKLKKEECLPLVDLCMPALRRMQQSDYLALRNNMDWLVHADKVVSFFEYTLSKLVLKNLDVLFVEKAEKKVKFKTLSEVAGSCTDILSHLAVVGDGTVEQRKEAFAQALSQLGLETAAEFPDSKSISLKKVDAALKQLEYSSLEIKEKLLYAASFCVAFDGVVNPNELCLIRAIGSHLECPVPLA